LKDHTGDPYFTQLRSGTLFWPLDPDPELIKVEDVAHALSNLCRYAGHCSEFYSVAQHCVLVSQLCGSDPLDQLRGLLHDATEAYLVDVPRPVKRQLPEYTAAEKRLESAIEAAFNVDGLSSSVVKRADELALWIEADRLMQPLRPEWWTRSVQDSELYQEAMSKKDLLRDTWSPGHARGEYLLTYRHLRVLTRETVP
jgi:hypothetical protein